jgi:hypothetical protein
MSREDLRRWVEGHRAAQRRERAEAAVARPDPAIAIRHALALIALSGRLHARSDANEAADRRDDEAARATWTRLRTVLLKRGRSR